MIELTESTSEIVHLAYEEAYGPGYEDMQRRVPDCTRARRRIGFDPVHSLADIVNDVAMSQVSSVEAAVARAA